MCWAEVVKISLKVAEGGFGKTSQEKEKRIKGRRRRRWREDKRMPWEV
jgi:hypothetical protein